MLLIFIKWHVLITAKPDKNSYLSFEVFPVTITLKILYLGEEC